MTSIPNEFLRALLILLLAVPAAAAVAAALLGPRRLGAIRALSLAATLVTLAAAVVLAVGFVEIRDQRPLSVKDGGSVVTFRPEIVPGAAEDDPRLPAAHRTTWDLIEVG